MRLRGAPLGLTLVIATLLSCRALAQTTVTYHLHNEASTINAARQLKTSGPDITAVVLRSGDLKNASSNWFLTLGDFETQAGEPNVAGIIPANSVITFSIWLRQTTADGVFHPAASLHFNQYWGAVPGLCSQGIGPNTVLPKLTTTLKKYSFTCTIPEARTMGSTDRFYVEVGAWVDSGPGKRSVQVELDLEGTLNGNYDSTMIVPLPQRPTITSLTPSNGTVGQAVTVQGNGFGATQGSSTVAFNGTVAAASAWSDTSIVTSVPAGSTTGPVIVTVGQPSNGMTFTVVPPPTLTSLTPTSGTVGQTITVAGTAFGSTQGTSSVKFNGIAAPITSWSDNSIAATVPAGATSGPVVVTVNGQTSNGIAFSVIPPPAISSVSPAIGVRGQAVTISGSSFGAAQSTSTVVFNGVVASVSAWADSSVTATVPSAATTGAVVVTVNGQASNAVTFTVIPPPTITLLTPATGIAAQSVTIAGTNFGQTQGSSGVTFNGVTAAVTAWSDTSIATSVPAAATTGPVVVTVNGQASNAVTFTVVAPPAVTSINPPSGVTGQEVAVNGSYFGTAQGSSTITFNGAAASVARWSDTAIVVAVPAGAGSGPVVVTVDGRPSNGVTFTVIPPPDVSSVTPDSGTIGESVTIAGTSFGSTQGASTVTFNGVSASPTSWSASEITATIPAGATTGPLVVTVNGQSSTPTTFTVRPTPIVSAVAVYPFSEATGASTADKSGFQNDGFLMDAPVWTAAGRFGNGLTFSSGAARVEVPVSESLELSDAFTFELWARPTSDGVQELVGRSDQTNGVALRLNANREPTFTAQLTTGVSSVTAAGAIPLDAWTHLAVTFDGAHLRLYVNGTEVAASDAAGTLPASTSPWRFGFVDTGGFGGTLDEIRIYRRALSPSEIVGDMTAPGDDTTPFQVARQTPPNGAIGVLTKTIAVTFTQAADPVTVGPSTVQLTDVTSAPVPAEVTYDAATRTATVTSSASLLSLSQYSVRVVGGTSGVLSATGAPLSADVTWSFRTAADALTPSAGFSFSESNGQTAADISGNGNVGTLINDPVWTAGRSGAALAFDGTAGQRVEVPASETLTLPDTFTIQLWIYPTSNGVSQELVGRDDPAANVLLRLSPELIPSLAATFTSDEQGVSATEAIPLNAWTNLAVTYDGERLHLFVNGSEVASAAASGGLVSSLQPWRVGSVQSGGFAGTLDEIRIYRLALVGSEIAAGMSDTTGQPVVDSVSPSTAAANEPITITGSSFGPIQGTSNLQVNGMTALVTSWSDNQIIATVPSSIGSGAVTVTVTVNDVPSNAAPLDVVLKPVISALSTTAGYIGQAVTITGSNFGTGGTIQFSGAAGTATAWTDTSITTTVPLGTTTGRLTVTVNGWTSNEVEFSKSGATSTGGLGVATVWSTEDGMDADIGTWDGSPEPCGCTFFNVDVDVPDGGGNLTFTYGQRRSYTPDDDYLDVYLLEPGITWDPGSIWSEDGSIRCFSWDFPPGVIPVIRSFMWLNEPGDTGDYQFSLPLDQYKNQSVRVVFRQWNDGYDDETQSRVRDLRFNPIKFQITSPAAADKFPLSENNHRETQPITFRVESDAQSVSAVNWTADLEYATSGNRAPTNQQDTFQTQANASVTRTYEARGGQITLRASATVDGTARSTPPLKFYVVGVPIPNAEITTRLTGLYAGATSNLLTGIAMVESSYMQFANRVLYGVDARWPKESYDGGSHIGLMQVPVTFANAWDWMENTATGAAIFADKLAAAGRNETRIRNAYPGLRALSDVERENMALLLYGPNASGDLTRQYYIPRSVGQTVDWAVNTQNNPNGVAYANTVRANLQ